MNHFLKFLKWFFACALAVFLLLVLVAELAEDAIVNRVLKEINASVPARVEINDVSFSLVRKFPMATLEFHDILMTSNPAVADSTFTADTLINAQRLYVSVDAIALLKGKLDIKRFDLEKGSCSYFIDKQGHGNFDFLLSEFEEVPEESSPAAYDINLETIMLKEISMNYQDQQNSIEAHLFFKENMATIQLNQDDYQAQISGNASCTHCRFPNVPLHKMKKADLDYQLAYSKGELTIQSLKLLSEGVGLNATGKIETSQKFPADIHVQDCKINLNTVSKYIPKTLLRDYEIKRIAGLLNLNANIKGDLLDSILPQTRVDFTLRKGQVLSRLYPPVNHIELKCQLGNGTDRNLQSTFVNCEKLYFTSHKSKAGLSFQIKNFTQPQYAFASDCKLNLDEFKAFVPDSLIRIEEGEILAQVFAEGKLASWEQLQDIDYLRENCRADIQIKDFSGEMLSSLPVDSVSAQLSYSLNSLNVEKLRGFFPQYHLNLKNSSLSAFLRGSLANISQCGLDVASFRFETDSCQLLGSASLDNLIEPDYKISGLMDLNFAELKKMIPDTLITDMKGQVGISFKSEGHFHPDSIASQLTDLLMNKSKTEINFHNIALKLPQPMMAVEGLSGQLSLKPDTITINNTQGVFAGMDFKVDSSQVTNYYRTLIDNREEELSVRVFLHFGDLDYALIDSLMRYYAVQTDSVTAEGAIEPTNYRYLVKGRISGNSFSYQNVKFTDIQSLFNVTDSLYVFDQFKFNAFGGEVNNSIKYSIDSYNRQLLAVKNKTKQVDIKQCLTDFDNFKDFDQDYIVADQLSGKLTTDLHGQFLLLGDTLVNDSTMLRGDLKLEDGALYNYEPLQVLSQSTNITELDSMKFKTIESQVFVFENAVFVPQTEIKSNAMDISAYGMQTLDEDYEYHLRIYLGEILYGKTKRIRERQAKNKNKPNGGASGLKSLFLVSKSIDGKDKNGLDTKKARMKMKTKVKLQLMKLEIIFHPKLEKFETGVMPFTKYD